MRVPLVLLLTVLGSAGWAASAIAHGVSLQQQTVSSVEVQARYNSGEPMQEAQVTVYAPADPKRPWLQGTTDAAGRFLF
ncbi:MAG TPA: carboxypeptidase regulatory-like domain-containing protein, partial [Leptolyngbyaceae cyanobacterium M65_K2018_010]|nr:carboxypeptidase regulatory-like domain-containing protein [Leptolyngbyaceae cyanobacterium M65_K2018_010]